MKVAVTSGDITRFKADAIIVNLFEGVAAPAGGTGAVDQALGGLISEELKTGNAFKGKLGDTLVLHTHGKLPARYVIVVGLGKQDSACSFEYRRASAAAVKACKKLKVKTAGTLLHGAGIGGFDVEAAARILAEGTCLGDYSFDLRKSGPKDEPTIELETVTIVEHDGGKLKAAEKGAALGTVIAKFTNMARNWVNDAPNHVTPTFLKEQAEDTPGLTVNVLDINGIRESRMGMFELVAKGSDHPPYLIHMAYKPENASKKVTMVGKGLTFDSGGLSLKPAKSMETMKLDMAGSAAVIATMKAIAELGNLNVEVHGFVGACENMPSGRSSKPGDIVTSMKGKTVEVNNTDAEGRLVLGDVIFYAQRQTDPDELIDLATLTGAQVVALGSVAAAVMGKESGQTLIDQLKEAGQKAGEKLWQLPLYDEYRKSLESEVADIINAGSKGEAGSQNGGLFVGEFVDEGRNWAHIDIAGPAFGSQDFPEVPKGGSGFGVRTLLYYLYNLS